MKKNILLVLLSASLLTGCELDLRVQRFFGLIKEEPQSEEQQEEQKENNQENQENPEENPENSGENGGQGQGQQGGNEQTPDIPNEYVATISTSGTAISGYATSAGVQADTDLSSGANNAANLTNCLKAQLQHEECLTSTWFQKINSAEWDSECIIQIGTGNPAKDNFNSGTFRWNSNAKIYKVEITAMCYAKPPYSEDSNAKIKIDNDAAQTLKASGDTDVEFKTVTKEYENGANTFAIQSVDGRVLLKSLKITWRL